MADCGELCTSKKDLTHRALWQAQPLVNPMPDPGYACATLEVRRWRQTRKHSRLLHGQHGNHGLFALIR